MPGEYQNRVPGKAYQLIERPELARTVAPASCIEEVAPLRIVVLQFQTAQVGDDEAAVPKPDSADDVVEKIALALVATPDHDAGLLGQTPSLETILRTGIVAIAVGDLIVALVRLSADDTGLLGRAPGFVRARTLVDFGSAAPLLGQTSGPGFGCCGGTRIVTT